MKNVMIAGGTGHIGSSLAKRLVMEGYNVNILTRNAPKNKATSLNYIYWDGENIGSWTERLNETDIVINLCGKSVDCRYTESNKLKLIRSRVNATRLLGDAIVRSERPPRLWINASSSAYYGFSAEAKDEQASAGTDFPARICVEWEKAFMGSLTPATRRIAWRLGVVLQPDKGLIKPFERLVKNFLGGKLGSGKQYFTWIHEEDFLNSALWTIENTRASGIYNLTSPEPITNADFMTAMRKAMDVSIGLSLPERLIRIGGTIIGTEPYLVLDGRRVIPRRLLESGFTFRYANIQGALDNLYKRESNGV